MSDIQFIEVDAQKINKELVNDFSMALDETLYPGDERRIFLDQETQVIVNLKNEINETGKQNLLRYAKGAVLDAYGERRNTPRLPAQKSVTTFKWTLSSAQPIPITIAKGKRGSPDGTLYFENSEDLIIPSGQTYGTVKAEATETGEKYNGFLPGQINQIVDRDIPYVLSVENIDKSSGGSDIEPDDDGVNIWSGYRERIRLAPGSYSTAGPEDAYIYWAKTADSNITDVAVTSPSPGVVKITVLMKDGELPTQEILDKVLAVTTPKNRRPLTDNVQSAAPTEVTYNIELTYYIASENSTDETNIRNAIEGYYDVNSNYIPGAIDKYNTWQSAKLGKSIKAINPDYLRLLMLNSKAFRINITSPVYTEIEDYQVAKVGTISVTYGGLI